MGEEGGSGKDWVTAGAGYAGRSGGKWFFEVEVLDAVGYATVGIAGTNFRGAIRAEIGTDELAWAIYSGTGRTYHRHVPDPLLRLLALARLPAGSAPPLSPCPPHPRQW